MVLAASNEGLSVLCYPGACFCLRNQVNSCSLRNRLSRCISLCFILKKIYLMRQRERKRERKTPSHWFIAPNACGLQRRSGLKSAVRNCIQIAWVGGRDASTGAFSTAHQGVHLQEAGIRSQSRDSNPGTLELGFGCPNHYVQ